MLKSESYCNLNTTPFNGLVLQASLGKLAAECQTILVFTAARDDGGDGGDGWNSETCT